MNDFIKQPLLKLFKCLEKIKQKTKNSALDKTTVMWEEVAFTI